jgi:uncharacterized protein YcbK (DUF882 family)
MNISNIVKLLMSLSTYHTTRSTENSQPQTSVQENKKMEPKIETHFTWKRGEDVQLSENFSSREFSCKCVNSDCVDQKISKDLIDRLQKLRTELGAPLRITSAFRCTKHQAALRGSGIKTATGTSTHELGEAVDVQRIDRTTTGLEPLAAKHFESIGISKNFLHLDTRKGYRRWDY